MDSSMISALGANNKTDLSSNLLALPSEKSEKDQFKSILEQLQQLVKSLEMNAETTALSWKVFDLLEALEAEEHNLEYLYLFQKKISKVLFRLLELVESKNGEAALQQRVLNSCLFMGSQQDVLTKGVNKVSSLQKQSKQFEDFDFLSRGLKALLRIEQSIYLNLSEGSQYVEKIIES